MILTYQYRVVPTKSQHRALEALLESQRLLYNAALEERIGAYRRGVSRKYIDQTKALTEWRRSDPEASFVPVALQRATLKRLDEAYNGFFRRVKLKRAKAGFPRFRGKGWWDSFAFSEFKGISFDGTRLRFRGMPGALNVHIHRPLPQPARIRSCTFRRDTKGWKVGFAVDIPVTALRDGRRSVGVDLGIATFAALSDGGFIPSLKAARRAERRLRVAQRSVARRQRNSKSRCKARMRVARCHAATARRRSNFLHQASARLIRDYDLIAVEALSVQGLARGALARDVHDASWSKFLSILRYKAERAGVRLIEVDPNNTSQDCSGCGMRVSKHLHDRWHDCPHCGLSIDRDFNAARNILDRAGVGPGLHNVADRGKRAGGNLRLTDVRCQLA
ncbi:MAG: IS200/IS605 family element transposase accessory protein TnpB [Burkholderiales bacterium]|nr:IS200/IS605 family element transposase accessory protein TnpB [Burkholderiales bacterium]